MMTSVKNRERLKKLLLQDDLYKDIFAVKTWEDRLLDKVDNAIVVRIPDMNKDIAVVLLCKESETSISFHGGICKSYRGQGQEFLKRALSVLKEQMPDMAFWTKIPSTNVAAIKLALLVGCKEFGRLPKGAGGADLIFYRW